MMTDTQGSPVSPIPRRTPDEAYVVYVGPANRSLAATAELCDLPLGTVKRWCHEHSWADRADRESALLRSGMDRQVRAVLAQKMPKRLVKLDQLCDSEDQRISLQANAEWIKLYGVPPADLTQPTIDDDTDSPDYDTMSIADLAAYVRQQRERRQSS